MEEIFFFQMIAATGSWMLGKFAIERKNQRPDSRMAKEEEEEEQQQQQQQKIKTSEIIE
jgi:hypothetical protein